MCKQSDQKYIMILVWVQLKRKAHAKRAFADNINLNSRALKSLLVVSTKFELKQNDCMLPASAIDIIWPSKLYIVRTALAIQFPMSTDRRPTADGLPCALCSWTHSCRFNWLCYPSTLEQYKVIVYARPKFAQVWTRLDVPRSLQHTVTRYLFFEKKKPIMETFVGKNKISNARKSKCHLNFMERRLFSIHGNAL